jgi:hypothetical protein
MACPATWPLSRSPLCCLPACADVNGYAIYFSRGVLPYNKDGEIRWAGLLPPSSSSSSSSSSSKWPAAADQSNPDQQSHHQVISQLDRTSIDRLRPRVTIAIPIVNYVLLYIPPLAGSTPHPGTTAPTCCIWACSATIAASCGSTARCQPRRCRCGRLCVVYLQFYSNQRVAQLILLAVCPGRLGCHRVAYHTFALEMVPLLVLQMMEDLEQLKILENGYRMKVGGSCPHSRVWLQGSGCRFS